MLQEAREQQRNQQAQTMEARNTVTQFAQYSTGTTIVTNSINFLPNTEQQTEQVSGIMGLSISLFKQFGVVISLSPCF
jgi:hypothetical protein